MQTVNTNPYFCRTNSRCSQKTAAISGMFSKVQGGSNMTGTNCDLFTHKQSRSYLNHLVQSTCCPQDLNLIYSVSEMWMKLKHWSTTTRSVRCIVEIKECCVAVIDCALHIWV
jgi:hypothetical protein